MKHIKELAQLAKSLEKQTAVCKQCGVCLSACPLYPQTRLEKDVARGKIAILDGVMSEVVKNAKNVRDGLDRCLLCGSCAGVCPNGVNSLEIFFKARVLLTEYLGLSPIKKLIFQQLLSNPGRFNKVAGLAAKVQRLFLKKSRDSLGTSRARVSASPLLADRHIIPLAPVPFHRQDMPSRKSDVPATGETVLFFTGCLIDKIFPQVAQSSIKALDHHGFNVILPKNEGCCGIPALSAGDMISFSRLLTHNLDQFKKAKFDHLVTACATCAYTIKKVWPMMVEPEDENYGFIRQLADQTIDITELIVDRLGEDFPPPVPDAIKITYHDPCHLKKSLGVYQAPRRLISANPNCQLVEMEGADVCCGMGGGFGLAHNELSEKIGRSKQDNITAAGCRIVATACPACMIQLAGLLSKSGDENMRVCHPIEIYMSDEFNPNIS